VPSADPNQHVREYLNYYIDFKHAPHYAVLLKGVWGIGKTFLVRQILDAYYADKQSTYIYLSLYGLSSYEDLDRALRNAIFPILDNKAAVVGTKVAKAALGFFKVKTDLNLGDFTSKFKDSLYVFDDLERCALPMQKVMGYINEFVEHDSCKVVIIANEEAIKEQDDYLDRREKTVGKVLEVQSSIDEALTFFLSKVEDVGTRTFLHARADEIVTLFAQSGLHNLRILQQTLWDFERLYRVLDSKYKSNETALRVFVNLMFSLSFDVKSGRLREQDVAIRHEYQWFSFVNEVKKDEKLTRIQESIVRYVRVDLTDAILSNEVLIDVLFRGLVRPDEINACLAASHHYQEASEQAAWRLVWNLMEIPDDVFNAALTKMEEQFVSHEFVIPGELLHVFGLRLWTASEGLLGVTRAEAFEQNKAYVDYIYQNGALDKLEPDTLLTSLSGYAGLGIREEGTDDFKRLSNYFAERRKQARLNQHPVWGEEILDDMKNNRDVFSKVALQNGVHNPYYRIPVLATIEPNKFVETWLAMKPAAQKSLAVALDGRYHTDMLYGDLKDELPWLRQVKAEAERQLANASQPTLVRFRWLFGFTLDKYLPEQPEAEPTSK
jgi:hypothetical protein